MRKAIMMLGTILITAVIIISGSAVATWVFANSVVASINATDPYKLLGPDDNDPASLGNIGPPVACGWILVDLGSANAMPNSEDFTVFAACTVNVHNESYDVSVGESTGNLIYVGTGYDTMSMIFTTPSSGGGTWRYINLTAYYSDTRPDPAPGAELDAVGWDK